MSSWSDMRRDEVKAHLRAARRVARDLVEESRQLERDRRGEEDRAYLRRLGVLPFPCHRRCCASTTRRRKEGEMDIGKLQREVNERWAREKFPVGEGNQDQ